MEVFTAFTPICSRNYKAILESLQDELSDTPKIFHSGARQGPRQGSGAGRRRGGSEKELRVKRDTQVLPG